MREPFSFYTIYEYDNEESFYKRNGFEPYTTELKEMEDVPVLCVTQYVKKGFVFDVLESSQCYSGAMVTLARVPSLGYDDLLDTALKSKNMGERRGAIGMMLKNYPQKLETFLDDFQQGFLVADYTRKEVLKIIKFINEDIYPYYGGVKDLEKILSICKQLENNV